MLALAIYFDSVYGAKCLKIKNRFCLLTVKCLPGTAYKMSVISYPQPSLGERRLNPECYHSVQ